MNSTGLSRPFPDYVTCPKCHEPEVEVWCYALQATCYNCGHVFAHQLPTECRPGCTEEERARAAQHQSTRSNDIHACVKIIGHNNSSVNNVEG